LTLIWCVRVAGLRFSVRDRRLLLSVWRWLLRGVACLLWRKSGWRVDWWLEWSAATTMRQGENHRLLHIVLCHLGASSISCQRHGSFMNHQIPAQAIHPGLGAEVSDRPRQSFIELHRC
jgi:hypothetical protein